MTSEHEIRSNITENDYENIALSLTSSISSSPVISNSSSAASSSSTLPVDNTEAIEHRDFDSGEHDSVQKLKTDEDATYLIKKKPSRLSETNNNDEITTSFKTNKNEDYASVRVAVRLVFNLI